MGALHVIPTTGDDRRRYAPDRDLAYCWPYLVRLAMNFLAKDKWSPEIKACFEQSHVTEEDLAQAAEAYGNFFVIATTDVEVKDAREALMKAKFLDVRPAAAMALCMTLGQLLTGTFFMAIRDVTMLDEYGKPKNPPIDMKGLMRASRQACKILRAPAWLKWWYRTWFKLHNWFLRDE